MLRPEDRSEIPTYAEARELVKRDEPRMPGLWETQPSDRKWTDDQLFAPPDSARGKALLSAGRSYLKVLALVCDTMLDKEEGWFRKQNSR